MGVRPWDQPAHPSTLCEIHFRTLLPERQADPFVGLHVINFGTSCYSYSKKLTDTVPREYKEKYKSPMGSGRY